MDHLRDLFKSSRGHATPLDDSIKLVGELDAQFVNTNKNKTSIRSLVEGTRNYGTRPFAILARYAFIAQSLIDSMVQNWGNNPR